MSDARALIQGRCPGALQPMAAADGLILRVRPRIGKLSFTQLRAFGELAARFGDGRLFLSNRANIQMRGVKAADHPLVVESLAAHGLIDRDADIEAVRNIVISPMLALQRPTAPGAELAARIEQALSENEILHSLPPKFGVAIQSGSECDLAFVGDMTFLIFSNRIAMLLDGAHDRMIPFSNADQAAAGFVRAAKAFLRLKRNHPLIRRMRDAVLHIGLAGFFREGKLSSVAHTAQLRRRTAPVGDLGTAYGIAFAFGEVTRTALTAIVEAMRCEGASEVAVSPHRALVFPCGSASAKARLAALAERTEGIIEPNDLRLRIHGCLGAPHCARATVKAREDAFAVLAAMAGARARPGSIHISGCEKRCAWPHDAEIVAIGANGRYRIIGPDARTRDGVASAELAAAVFQIVEGS